MSRASPAAVLQVRGLNLALPGPAAPRPVLHEIDLQVAAGECVAIVGESGAGKTQLARALMGLSPAGASVQGRLVVAGVERSLADPDAWWAIRGAGIGMVFQDSLAALAPHRTLGQQLADVLLAHGAGSRAQARLQARHWFDRVRIAEADRRLSQYPSELSGGLRQRAAIALALAARPAVLIADEPTSALDPTLAVELLGLFADLKDNDRVGLILISHDLAVVAGLADRVLTLYAGRIVEQAPADILYATPRHPYTARLLGRRAPGNHVPEVLAPTDGCAYRARCEAAGEACASPPAPRLLGDTLVRCHHPMADPS